MLKVFVILALCSITCISNSDSLAATGYFPSVNIPAPERSRFWGYSEILFSMKEKPLWPVDGKQNNDSYRLTIILSRSGPVVFRLTKGTKGSWILDTKKAIVYSNKEIDLISRRKCLSTCEGDQLEKIFQKLQFWQLPSIGPVESEYNLLDGSTWILEAVKRGRYHFVRRRSPENLNEMWLAEPEFYEDFRKLKDEKGYPNIDRSDNLNANNTLVSLGSFLMKISDVNLR